MATGIGDSRRIGDILQGTLLRKDDSTLDGKVLLRATGKWENPIEWGRAFPTIEVNVRTLQAQKDTTNEDWI